MRFESFFETDGDLIVVEVAIAGPRGEDTARLILDTGAALTTVIPAVAESIGYSAADRIARSVIRSAAAMEHGYILRVERIAALGIDLPAVYVNVAELGHGIDGLLGMNFLNEINLELRPAEKRIIVERITARLRLPTFAEAAGPSSHNASALPDFEPRRS
jgi:predicted aspartyl protease